jgi:hypothetical protein
MSARPPEPNRNVLKRVVAVTVAMWFSINVFYRVVGVTVAMWVIIVVAGLLVAVFTIPHPMQYVAVRDLKPNHRLIDGDVAEVGPYNRFLIPGKSTRDDFLGRYVASAVTANTLLPLESTLTGPRLFPVRGSSIGWLSLTELPPAQIAALDVQDVLEVCNLNQPGTCGQFAVAAIVCSESLASCSAGIHLSPAQRRTFVIALGKGTAPSAQIHVLTASIGGNLCPHGKSCH